MDADPRRIHPSRATVLTSGIWLNVDAKPANDSPALVHIDPETQTLVDGDFRK
jgi:hypothetical protein